METVHLMKLVLTANVKMLVILALVETTVDVWYLGIGLYASVWKALKVILMKDANSMNVIKIPIVPEMRLVSTVIVKILVYKTYVEIMLNVRYPIT